MSTLYQQWQDLAYDETADRSQLEKFWGTYFQIEMTSMSYTRNTDVTLSLAGTISGATCLQVQN